MKRFSRLASAFTFLVALIFLSLGSSTPRVSAATIPTSFQFRSMTISGVTYKYQVFIPQNYDASKQWPLILSLHGSGEKGSDGTLQLTQGFGPYVKNNQNNFSAIVVFPQFPQTPEGTPYAQTRDILNGVAMTSLSQAMTEFSVDTSRVYLTGISFGAIRGWDLVYNNPNTFAAFMPVSGIISPRDMSAPDLNTAIQLVAQKLKSIPIWVFHGALDTAVPVAGDRATVQAFKNLGSSIKYTEFPNFGHVSWDDAYNQVDTVPWLLAQTNSTFVAPVIPAPVIVPTVPPVVTPNPGDQKPSNPDNHPTTPPVKVPEKPSDQKPTIPGTPPVISLPKEIEHKLPKGVGEGDVVKFKEKPEVYVVKEGALHPFDNLNSLDKYTEDTGKRLKQTTEKSTLFTVDPVVAKEVLNQPAVPQTFKTGDLVKDSGIIYYIYKDKKVEFKNAAVVNSLGFKNKEIKVGDTSNYQTPESGFKIESSVQMHPFGTWLLYNKTVYYSSDKGMIPVATMDVFLSNGGTLSKVLKANNADIQKIKESVLIIMNPQDDRVN